MTRARDLADFNLDGKAVTINESSADLDFRVESNGNANMLFVDGGNDKVGIGTNSPAKPLTVIGGDFSTLLLDNSDASHGTQILFQHNGTTNTGCDIQMSDAGGMKIRTLAVEPLSFHTSASAGSPSERMRILTDGKIVQGGTTHDFSGNFGIQIDASGSDNANIIFRTASDSETFIVGADQSLDAGVLNVLSNDPMVFKTNDTERMRIDNTGRVSIHPDGTAFTGESSADNLNIYQTGANVGMTLRSDDDRAIGIYFADAASGDGLFNGFIQYNNANELFDFAAQHSSAQIRLIAGGNERLRVTSGGRVGIGQSSPAGRLDVNNNGATTETIMILSDFGGTGAHTQISFNNTNGQVGTINTSGSATSFNTSSDRRLKSNIEEAASASDKIDAIQVRQFDWNADGSHQDYGLIAQELEPIEPMAVTGDADSDEMMGVDYSKLVPMLIKEIQELRSRVATLEAS